MELKFGKKSTKRSLKTQGIFVLGPNLYCLYLGYILSDSSFQHVSWNILRNDGNLQPFLYYWKLSKAHEQLKLNNEIEY